MTTEPTEAEGGAAAPPDRMFLPRTFRCCCGHDHELVDDNDVWTDEAGRIVGRTECLVAAGRITAEQAGGGE